MTAYDVVTGALRTAGMKVTESQTGARSQCPSHGSRSLTLALRRGPDGSVLVHCHAGCETADVLAEVDLTLADLYEPKDSRTVHRRGQSRPRPKPTPFEALIPDPDHFAARCLQQEQIDGVPLDPFDELDRAWAAHCAQTAPRAEVTPPVVSGDPARQASFAEWVRERLEVDPTLAPPAGRVVLRGSNGRNRVFDLGDPGYGRAARLATEVVGS